MAKNSPYSHRYQRIRRMMLDPPVPCAHCKSARATTLDHDPPLAMHVHREGSGCCRLIPSCAECNRVGGLIVSDGYWRPGFSGAASETESEPEREGRPQSDRCWRVPWLQPLLDAPPDAVWPRLMTVPHPRAVDSLGAEFCTWAAERSGRELRWWQQLVATRILEVDADGRLVWETVVWSTARQVGKSWLLRELLLWRIHQGERFGEAQDVIHTGKDLAVCKEVQRPARVWAKARGDRYKVREVNGQEEIELLADGSRWMLRAKEAVYGYSAAVGAADEAWKVKPSSIEEGLTPTMVEREQPQLYLVSTAHRAATSLMLARRQVAIDQLDVGDGDLLVEWSAPAAAALDDVEAWRLASPHWTSKRHRLIEKRLDAARAGEAEPDPDEPDPVQAFAAQWMNVWPRRVVDTKGPTEPLLPDGLWADLAEPELRSTTPLYVALEDDYGLGAAVAAVALLDDGRLEVDGWLCPDWDAAVADLRQLREQRPIRRLLVGASLLDRVPTDMRPTPTPAGSAQTRVGLSVFRDLALAGQLVHDHVTYELDATLEVATVRESPIGLVLVARGPTHLIRATVWAVQAAHRPVKVPAVR